MLVGDVVAEVAEPRRRSSVRSTSRGVTLAGLDDRELQHGLALGGVHPGQCGGSAAGQFNASSASVAVATLRTCSTVDARVFVSTMAPGNRAAMASSCACSRASSSFSSSVIPDEVVVELGAVAADQGEVVDSGDFGEGDETGEVGAGAPETTAVVVSVPQSTRRVRRVRAGRPGVGRVGDDRRQASVEIGSDDDPGQGRESVQGGAQVVRGDRIRSFLAGVAQRVEEALRPLLDVVVRTWRRSARMRARPSSRLWLTAASMAFLTPSMS